MSSTSATYQNLYQALKCSALRRPDNLALAFEDVRFRYRDFHERVQRVMAQLDRVWSLRKGDRILLAWGNRPEFCGFFCCSRLRNSGRTIQYQTETI